ncbi:hypothetical protein GE061_008702 [Apolygus lucorum]|uniref:Uncharacterized protein n=1 Tax=Apolygus lucorum TaxID=248454 RepID=A0A8S9WPJ9_APOLU|nr:hypothetical protein GE061_008702 [Apolygus lucorum]
MNSSRQKNSGHVDAVIINTGLGIAVLDNVSDNNYKLEPSYRSKQHFSYVQKNEKLEAAKTKAEERKKRKEEAEEIKKKKLEEKLKKQKEKLTKKPKVSVRRSRRRHSLSSEDEEEWQPSGDSEDEPQQEDFPEPVEEEAEPHELSLEAEVTTRSLNEIAEKGEQPHNLVVAEHRQDESLEHLEEEFQLADSTIQPNVNSENGMLSNDMIIESIFDLSLDITHKDYAERDREDRDEEGKTREMESEYNIIDGEDSGKKNLKGSFVLATFQKPRGSFNMVCEVVSQDNTFASVFTYLRSGYQKCHQ